MTNFTPAQLEAWAGSTAKHPEVITKEMWIERVALFAEAKLHAPALARLVLEKDAEIARLRKFLSELEADCEADYPPSHGAIKYAIRQAMKETSDE